MVFTTTSALASKGGVVSGACAHDDRVRASSIPVSTQDARFAFSSPMRTRRLSAGRGPEQGGEGGGASSEGGIGHLDLNGQDERVRDAIEGAQRREDYDNHRSKQQQHQVDEEEGDGEDRRGRAGIPSRLSRVTSHQSHSFAGTSNIPAAAAAASAAPAAGQWVSPFRRETSMPVRRSISHEVAEAAATGDVAAVMAVAVAVGSRLNDAVPVSSAGEGPVVAVSDTPAVAMRLPMPLHF